MISRMNLEALEVPENEIPYVHSESVPNVKEAKEEVLSRAGKHGEAPQRANHRDSLSFCRQRNSSEARHYIVCFNDKQPQRTLVREGIIESLKEELAEVEKSLIRNRGYRKYLVVVPKSMSTFIYRRKRRCKSHWLKT